MTFNPDAATVYASGPTSDPYEPSKEQIRALLKQYETVMNAFTTNAGLIYTTMAAMNAAATTFTEPRSAWQFEAGSEGIYVLNPTTDTWAKVGRLPYSWVPGTDLGAGTANAIQITTDTPVADGMIVMFSLFEATTLSPVTVSINGGAALTLKTNRGGNASALTADMEIWGRYRASDSTLRMLNDQDVSALVEQAEAFKDAAEAAVNSINQRIFTDLADAQAATIPASVKRLSTQFRTPLYAVPATLVGGARYRRASFADLTGYPASSYFRSIDRLMPDGTTDATNGGYWVIDEVEIWAEMLGAILDGTEDCTSAINDAITVQGLRGGGEVLIGPGTAILSNSNPGATSWDDYRAIYVGVDNIHIRGAGRGATKLKLANAADCHVVKFGARAVTTVIVTNCSISGVEIDGNRANQSAPTDAADHWHGVDIASGCSRITVRDFYIHDCQYYGIGGQRTNLRYNTIENGVIENVGADGIDWKNDDGDGRGNVIRDITVINPGLATVLSLAEAAFDFRSGVYFENLTAHTLTAEADLVGLRINVDANSTESTLPDFPTTGRGVTLSGNSGATSYGIRIAVRNTRVSDFFVEGFNQGVRISAPDVKISDFDVHGNAYGVVFTAGTTVEADTCEAINGTVRTNTTAGFLYESVDEVTVTNTDVRGNGIGHSIAAGSTSIRILGGSVSSNTTNVSDSGTSTVIRDVSGYKTCSAASVSVAIDSTGIKSVVIPHGLPFTPNNTDYTLTLRRNTNVGDWVPGFLWATSADATNVYGQLSVVTASSTVGAVVDVAAKTYGKTFT